MEGYSAMKRNKLLMNVTMNESQNNYALLCFIIDQGQKNLHDSIYIKF